MPMDGTGGSAPGAGSIANPNYSVSITDEEAKASLAQFGAEKDAKRLFPKNATTPAPKRVGIAVSSGLGLLPSLTLRSGSVSAYDVGLGAPGRLVSAEEPTVQAFKARSLALVGIL